MCAVPRLCRTACTELMYKLHIFQASNGLSSRSCFLDTSHKRTDRAAATVNLLLHLLPQALRPHHRHWRRRVPGRGGAGRQPVPAQHSHNQGGAVRVETPPAAMHRAAAESFLHLLLNVRPAMTVTDFICLRYAFELTLLHQFSKELLARGSTCSGAARHTILQNGLTPLLHHPLLHASCVPPSYPPLPRRCPPL